MKTKISGKCDVCDKEQPIMDVDDLFGCSALFCASCATLCTCANCGVSFSPQDAGFIFVARGELLVCHACKDGYKECVSCDNVVNMNVDEYAIGDDGPVCQRCMDNADRVFVLHSYNV